jgi:hypothetical protein
VIATISSTTGRSRLDTFSSSNSIMATPELATYLAGAL